MLNLTFVVYIKVNGKICVDIRFNIA